MVGGERAAGAGSTGDVLYPGVAADTEPVRPPAPKVGFLEKLLLEIFITAKVSKSLSVSYFYSVVKVRFRYKEDREKISVIYQDRNPPCSSGVRLPEFRISEFYVGSWYNDVISRRSPRRGRPSRSQENRFAEDRSD